MGTKLRECRSCTAQWTAISIAIADFTFTELQDLSTSQRCQYIDGDVMVTAPDIITLGSVARRPAHSGDYWDVSWPPLGRPAFQEQSEREKKGTASKNRILKLAFKLTSDGMGSHPDDLSVWVFWIQSDFYHIIWQSSGRKITCLTHKHRETHGCQHCGCWCPGAKAPGHQHPQCWLNIHCIGQVSFKNSALMVYNIRK